MAGKCLACLPRGRVCLHVFGRAAACFGHAGPPPARTHSRQSRPRPPLFTSSRGAAAGPHVARAGPRPVFVRRAAACPACGGRARQSHVVRGPPPCSHVSRAGPPPPHVTRGRACLTFAAGPPPAFRTQAAAACGRRLSHVSRAGPRLFRARRAAPPCLAAGPPVSRVSRAGPPPVPAWAGLLPVSHTGPPPVFGWGRCVTSSACGAAACLTCGLSNPSRWSIAGTAA